MNHVSLSTAEVNRLKDALLANGNDGAALMMGSDTSFAGTAPDLPGEQAVINAIKNVPTHY